jgi:hypothetical protein
LKQRHEVLLRAGASCAALLLFGCGRAGPANDRYTLERVVSFAAHGDAERFCGEGWSEPEPAFTWALGPRAELHMKVRWNNRPLGLRMRLAAFHHPPELPFQTVEVAANDIVVATWEVSKPAEFTAVIPPHVLAKKPALDLELRFANATSPQALGLSADARPLGVSCFEMQLTKAVAPEDIWPKLGAR